MVDHVTLTRLNGLLSGQIPCDLDAGTLIYRLIVDPDKTHTVFLWVWAAGPGNRPYVEASLWREVSARERRRVDIAIPEGTRYNYRYTFWDHHADKRYMVVVEPEPENTQYTPEGSRQASTVAVMLR